MKKLLLPVLLLLSAFLFMGNYMEKNKPEIWAGKKSASLISCSPLQNAVAITDEEFRKKYNSPIPLVRKNVYSLSAGEITSIKNGISAMKALPHTNPTSWAYQAAIHGTTLTDNLPSWNTCHQSGQSFFFLAWHRMYLYFFERILRAKSGDPNLTLPYWDYQTNPVLHPDYRNNSASNPLYDNTRSATINSGGSLPSSIMTAINDALDFIPYYDFQTGINGPHGSVHVTIGGNMVSVSSAAKDPVFWLHHGNIDRLWEAWLRKCNGRINPDDNPWLTKTYTFFDETGTAVNLSGSQVLNTGTQLNYRYDFSRINPCTIIKLKWRFLKEWIIFKRPLTLELRGKELKLNFTNEKQVELEKFISTKKRTRFNFESKTDPEKLILSMDGVKIKKMPEGIVEVYLNLPDNEKPSASSKSFVGLLDLFSAEHHTRHDMKGMKGEDKIELDASKAARALGLTVSDLQKAEIRFVVRGNSLRGNEITTEADISVQNLSFSIHEFRKE